MVYIVRTGPPYFDVYFKHMIKAIPSQSVIHDTGDNFNVLKNTLKFSPVFGKYYVVVLNYRKDKEFIQFLKWATVEKKYIKVVVYVKTKADYTTMYQKAEVNKIPHKIYDNYKASKRDKNIYITDYLSQYNIVLKPTMLEVIRGRLNGYSIEVNSFLEKVARLDKITAATIRKAIPSRNPLTSSSFGYMLFSEESSMEEFHKILFEYQYSPKILYNSVKDYLSKLMSIYKLYLTGEFSEVNYKSFVANNGVKYGVTSEYHAQNILDIFSRYSYPKLIMIVSLLSSTETTRLGYITTLYKVIKVCRG